MSRPYLSQAYPTSKTTIDGTERGISTLGAKAIRVIIRAPLGQTLNGEFDAKLATRHSRIGVVIGHNGTYTSSNITGGGEPPAATQDILIAEAFALGQKAVLVGHIPVAGDYDDELIVIGSGVTCTGTAADATEDGKYFVEMERLER